MKFITKTQAVRLVGEDEVKRIVNDNDTSLLMPSGAKLFTAKKGCIRRFGVYGYAHDGSDVLQVMASLG
jgi:hypothetical protein